MLVKLTRRRFDLLVFSRQLVVHQHLVDPLRCRLPETGNQLVAQPVTLSLDQDWFLIRVITNLLDQEAHLIDLLKIERIDLGHLRQLVDGVAPVHCLNQDKETPSFRVNQLNNQLVIGQFLLSGQMKIGRFPITGLDGLEEGLNRISANSKDGTDRLFFRSQQTTSFGDLGEPPDWYPSRNMIHRRLNQGRVMDVVRPQVNVTQELAGIKLSANRRNWITGRLGNKGGHPVEIGTDLDDVELAVFGI